MMLPIPPFLVSLLILTCVAVVVSALVYFYLRLWEKARPRVTGVIMGLGLVVLLYNSLPDRHFTLWVVGAFCIALIGTPFHHKLYAAARSSSASRSMGRAFLLLMFAVVVTQLLGITLASRIPQLVTFIWAWRTTEPVAFMSIKGFLGRYWSLCFAVPVCLMPMSLWLWQNLRLRPGLERALEDPV